MTVTSQRPILLAGVNLQTLGYNIEVIDGFYGRPGRRGKNRPTPYLDGAYSYTQKFYEPRRLFLRMGVYATDADGQVTHSDPFEHLYENLDTLFGLFHSDDLIPLQRTMGDGATIRQLDVEVLRDTTVTGSTPSSYKFVAELQAPRPFWKQLPVVSTVESGVTGPHAFNIAIGGNAPIGDAKITIDCTSAGSNPSLEIASSGVFVKYASAMSPGDTVVLDLAERSFTYNGARADAAIQRNRAWFLRFPPDVASLGMAFDADSGTYNVTIERYNQWF